MRKLFLAILGVLLAASIASAASPEISVSVPSSKKLVDNKYIISVDIADNPGFASLQIELFYNDDVLTCERVLPGEVLAGMLTDSNPSAAGESASAILSVAGTANTEKNGNLASFVFEKPRSGDPEIEFVLVEVVSADGERLNCKVEVDNNYGDGGTKPVSPGAVGGSGITIPSQTEEKKETEDAPPPEEVEVAPEVAPETPKKSFSDIAGHWASEYISEAVALGVVNGMPDGTFAPDKQMTRAEFATILWNMAKKPSGEAKLSFADVGESDWFYSPIAWAYKEGYINGVSEREFNPNGKITREQAMTILYRYAGSPEANETLEKFKDKETISPFALSAMSWAVENSIISGVSESEVAPKMSATRAQLATIIVRYLKK